MKKKKFWKGGRKENWTTCRPHPLLILISVRSQFGVACFLLLCIYFFPISLLFKCLLCLDRKHKGACIHFQVSWPSTSSSECSITHVCDRKAHGFRRKWILKIEVKWISSRQQLILVLNHSKVDIPFTYYRGSKYNRNTKTRKKFPHKAPDVNGGIWEAGALVWVGCRGRPWTQCCRQDSDTRSTFRQYQGCLKSHGNSNTQLLILSQLHINEKKRSSKSKWIVML